MGFDRHHAEAAREIVSRIVTIVCADIKDQVRLHAQIFWHILSNFLVLQKSVPHAIYLLRITHHGTSGPCAQKCMHHAETVASRNYWLGSIRLN